MNEPMIVATYSHYTAVYTKAIANMNVYFTHPVAIGEHSDLVAESIKLAEEAANAKDALDLLEGLYPWLKGQKSET